MSVSSWPFFDRGSKNRILKLINNIGGLLRRNSVAKKTKAVGAELSAGGSHMRTKIGALAAVAGLTLALGVSASRAAIVETIVDTFSDSAVGSITFPTLTGASDAGVLFSYRGFTQADITSISWSLDPTTDAVVALDLHALQGDNPCPNSQPSCSNSTSSLSPTLGTFGGTSCHSSGDMRECDEFFGEEEITFVPARPGAFDMGHDDRWLRWPRPCGAPIDETGGRLSRRQPFCHSRASGNPKSQESVAGCLLSRA
jgi:hypothetical protein